jgi:hypothetical protein
MSFSKKITSTLRLVHMKKLLKRNLRFRLSDDFQQKLSYLAKIRDDLHSINMKRFNTVTSPFGNEYYLDLEFCDLAECCSSQLQCSQN